MAIWFGEIWHHKTAPNFAVVLKRRLWRMFSLCYNRFMVRIMLWAVCVTCGLPSDASRWMASHQEITSTIQTPPENNSS